MPQDKTGDGLVVQIRVLVTVHRSAIKARVAVIRQIKSLLVTAPVRGQGPIYPELTHSTKPHSLRKLGLSDTTCGIRHNSTYIFSHRFGI